MALGRGSSTTWLDSTWVPEPHPELPLPGATLGPAEVSGADPKSRPAQSLEEPGNCTKHTPGLPGSRGHVLTFPVPKCCHSWAKWIIQVPAAERQATQAQHQRIGVGGGSVRQSKQSAWGLVGIRCGEAI